MGIPVGEIDGEAQEGGSEDVQDNVLHRERPAFREDLCEVLSHRGVLSWSVILYAVPRTILSWAGSGPAPCMGLFSPLLMYCG